MREIWEELWNSLWNLLEKIKKQENTGVYVLRIFYSIGKISWIHAMISTLFSIFIPILYEKKKFVGMRWAIAIVIFDILWAYICNEYQKKLFLDRKFTSELLEEFSSLIKSLNIFVQNEPDWKNKIYKTTSEMVCEKIYNIFKDVFKCDTRISIEYRFQKTFQTKEPEQRVRMVGRKSRHRCKAGKSIPLERKKKYYSYQIFMNNNKGMNILEEDEIHDPNIWYKNPANNVDVKRYIGIAVSVFDDGKVTFLLQIDFLENFKFGRKDSEEDVKNFVDRYLLPYVNIATLAYLLNLNNGKELKEV